MNINSAYNLENEDQIERVNQIIEDMLRAYCGREPSKWIQYLPLVEFAYNASYQSSIDMTPFKALYRHGPLSFIDTVLGNNHAPRAKDWLQ